MSKTSLYRLIWKTIKAINNCGHSDLAINFPTSVNDVKSAAAGFTSISKEGCIWNCVAVVDGYHLQTITPSATEVRNVRSFYSGHYKTHGVNIQGACDHHCRFVFLGVAGPGVMGDRDAIKQVELHNLIDALPGLYCVIGDCAYTPSEKMIPIYRGADATTARYDNFNFYASQLRIRIEMAFGLMTKKWGILTRPLSVKMKHVKHLMICIAKLHNFCIDERLREVQEHQPRNRPSQGGALLFTPHNVGFDARTEHLRELAAQVEFDEAELLFENAHSHNRERMAREVEALQLSRPNNRSRTTGQRRRR